MTLDQLETPVPLVDVDVMAHNLDAMQSYADAHGLALRPHTKTHKSVHVGREQVRRGAAGLTCATPHEATVMQQATDDLLVAYPVVGHAKLDRLFTVREDVALRVQLDSAHAIDELAAAAVRHDRAVAVTVEFDAGMHRVGVPSLDDAITLARHVAANPPLEFSGIAFYPGHIREPVMSQDAALARLRHRVGEALEAFADAGLPPAVVSGGSTPTMWRSHEITGVTEIRPGTYVYNDRTTAEIGACKWADCAFTVLATVVSTSVPGQAVIDAGAKALGREPIRGAGGEGWGALLDRPEVIVSRMSEEHGILDLANTDWRPQVGEQVRVVPNHVCIVTHLNDVIFGISHGEVVTSWPVDARGRGYGVLIGA
ncbi:MAG TPA: alanine racemase [Gemmatimonadaceae bacterium]|jgi:D-serine deaminase-like pyridoxal phosphate-dependent protein